MLFRSGLRGSQCFRVIGSRSVVSLFHSSRVLLRPRAPKANPHETQSGQFDKSFEKLTAQIEERLPFSQKNFIRGSVHDRLFGEETDTDLKKAAQDDLHGREPEKPAAKMARSYFSDEDLSPEALHVRSPHLKVSQNIQRQNYDKKILNTSNESKEYYYNEPSPQEKAFQQRVRIVAFISSAVVIWFSCKWIAAYMYTGVSGEPTQYAN